MYMLRKYLVFCLLFPLIGCSKSASITPAATPVALPKPAVAAMPDLPKPEVLGGVQVNNDLLDGFTVTRDAGSMRIVASPNVACVMYTGARNHLALETLVREKPGLWKGWYSGKYYTQPQLNEIKVYSATNQQLETSYVDTDLPVEPDKALARLKQQSNDADKLKEGSSLESVLRKRCFEGRNVFYNSEDNATPVSQ